jgi:hypothetical protein
MNDKSLIRMLDELADGRTELTFDLLEAGTAADYKAESGISLMQRCAYYGDVSAIRYLLLKDASLTSPGQDMGLNTAAGQTASLE